MATMAINWITGKLEELKSPDLAIGQILWLNGYGQSEQHHDRRAVYKIAKEKGGATRYHCVNLDTFETSIENYPRPASEIFGIGIYYTPGDLATQEEIDQALLKATEKAEKIRQEKELAQTEYDRLAAIGKAKFDRLAGKGYKAYIVARLLEDDSDIQTDYLGSKTVKQVILAGSCHTRKLFPEFRKAAFNCDIPEVRAMANAPEEAEQRENYSIGGGNYLANHHYDGWQIFKYPTPNENALAALYHAAGYEDGFWAK